MSVVYHASRFRDRATLRALLERGVAPEGAEPLDLARIRSALAETYTRCVAATPGTAQDLPPDVIQRLTQAYTRATTPAEEAAYRDAVRRHAEALRTAFPGSSAVLASDVRAPRRAPSVRVGSGRGTPGAAGPG